MASDHSRALRARRGIYGALAVVFAMAGALWLAALSEPGNGVAVVALELATLVPLALFARGWQRAGRKLAALAHGTSPAIAAGAADVARFDEQLAGLRDLVSALPAGPAHDEGATAVAAIARAMDARRALRRRATDLEVLRPPGAADGGELSEQLARCHTQLAAWDERVGELAAALAGLGSTVDGDADLVPVREATARIDRLSAAFDEVDTVRGNPSSSPPAHQSRQA